MSHHQPATSKKRQLSTSRNIQLSLTTTDFRQIITHINLHSNLNPTSTKMFRSTLRPLTTMATTTASRRATTTTITPLLTKTTTPFRPPAAAHFHTTPRLLVKPGDPLPDTDALMENNPGQRVNLAEEAQRVNNMLLIGVPAAFSPACSATHVPGYMTHPRAKEFEVVGVVSVNDVFV